MAAEPLNVEIDTSTGKNIAVLTLEQEGKPVIVMDEALLQRLDATFPTIPGNAQGLVIRSATERAFVAGANLEKIRDLPDDQLARYLAYGQEVFSKIFDLPYPTAAAINGAALGGGLELAMHFDGLIGSPNASGKPYAVGLPEAALGLCPGWGGTNLLAARIDAADGIRRTASGETLKFDDAVAGGLFDKVADSADQLVATACAWVAEQDPPGASGRDGKPMVCVERPATKGPVMDALDSVRSDLPDTEAARAVADCIDLGLTGGWAAALAKEIEHLVQLRKTERATEAINAFFSKSK
ncbi:MAG: enoyl-CoA hydratase/isomerase family protein [Planctomycetota bacterium]